MAKLFLSLEDAVLVATREFDIDPQLARQEFEQKCYVTDKAYEIGYHHGLYDAIEAIKDKHRKERMNETN